MGNNVYLLLDEFDTLCFLDCRRLSKILSTHSIEISESALRKRAFEVNFRIDRELKFKRNVLKKDFIHDYFVEFFKVFSIEGRRIELLIKDLRYEDSQRSLWMMTFKSVREGLEKLKSRGYNMSVISNSDGRAELILNGLKLRDFFDKVYDSYFVGAAKPEKEIFELALRELGLSKNRTLFTGDIFYIDVLGANKSGLPAIHIDRYDLYKSWPGMRIKSVAELPEILDGINLHDSTLFPFGIF